jgi:hypothetical protein
MPYTQEILLPIVEKLKQRTDYENISSTLQSGVDFLTGRTFEVPVFSSAGEAQLMGYFIPLLQIPDLWNDNDRLVLQLISPPVTWNVCRERFLATIVPLLDLPATTSSVVLRFSFFTSFLQQRGCSPQEVGSLLISWSGDGNNFDLTPVKFSPMRKFLQDLIKSAEKPMIDDYLLFWKDKGWNSLFYRLLLKGHPDREMEYLENVLQQPGHLIDQQEMSRVLLHSNVTRYEPLIGDIAANQVARSNFGAALYGYHLLASQLPEKYAQLLLKTAYDYLAAPGDVSRDREMPYSQVLHKPVPDRLPAGVIAIKEILLQDTGNSIPFLRAHIAENRYLHPGSFLALADGLKEQAAPLLLTALDGDYDPRDVLPALTTLDKSLYLEQLWPFTLHRLKSVRTLVAVVLAEHPQALERASELLTHKKADQRLTAVQILSRLDHPQARLLLFRALHSEVNDDARDIMLETLGGHNLVGTDEEIAAQLVLLAKKRFKLNKPAEKWLDDKALPPMYLLNGEVMSTDMMRFLFYRMGREAEIQPNVEALPVLKLVDRKRSGDFAVQLFKTYMAQSGEAKYKYLMTLAAAVGDETLIPELRHNIQYWIDTKRLKMAEHGVAALGLQGSIRALREVEYLSRRYRFRKSVVGAAAVETLQHKADEAGISYHELGDQLVPDFGFLGLYKPFYVNEDRYHYYVDSNFKAVYFNDKRRRLKAVPSSTPPETRAALKAVTREMVAAAKVQALRMEHFMVIQRKWSAARWQLLFLQNPLLFAFANRLLWGVFDEKDQLITPFYCRANGSLLSIYDTAVVLPPNGTVKIIHPINLEQPVLQQWKHKFDALSVVPVFPQLERPVAALLPQLEATTLVHDFEDISLESDALNRYMEQKGWKLSEQTDGKYSHAWYKTDDEHQLEVIMEMSSNLRNNNNLCKLGKLYFIDKTKAVKRHLRNGDTEIPDYLLPLKNVPSIFYSEAITDMAVSRKIALT